MSFRWLTLKILLYSLINQNNRCKLENYKTYNTGKRLKKQNNMFQNKSLLFTFLLVAIEIAPVVKKVIFIKSQLKSRNYCGKNTGEPN